MEMKKLENRTIGSFTISLSFSLIKSLIQTQLQTSRIHVQYYEITYPNISKGLYTHFIPLFVLGMQDLWELCHMGFSSIDPIVTFQLLFFILFYLGGKCYHCNSFLGNIFAEPGFKMGGDMHGVVEFGWVSWACSIGN